MPRVLVVSPIDPDAVLMKEAAQVLREGGLVAVPTETVYGLGARGLDERAVARIFQAKGRPSSHPLILHVQGLDDARALLLDPPDALTRAFTNAFWPGPLTIVLRRSALVPDAVTGGGDTVALRAPSHPVARALIAALGEPIAAPSANRYQTISPTTAAHVVKSLGDAVDLVIDAGPCESGIESTVLDLSEGAPRVLRPGAISLTALRAISEEVTLGATSTSTSTSTSNTTSTPNTTLIANPRRSPGMDDRHYAPDALVVIVGNKSDLFAKAENAAKTARIGVLSRGVAGRGDEVPAALQRNAGVVIEVLSEDAALYGHELYAALHRFEEARVDVIFVLAAPEEDAWAAVADRLRRAAGQGNSDAK